MRADPRQLCTAVLTAAAVSWAGTAAARPATLPLPRAGCPGADLLPSAENVVRIRRATLCLLNAERRKHGLPALHSNQALARVAATYSRQMVAKRFFGHVSPSGGTLERRIGPTAYASGARRWNVGENLAWGTGQLGTPATTMKHWMHSPGHRANILRRSYRDIGIGIAVGIPEHLPGAPLGLTYTTEFGRRSR